MSDLQRREITRSRGSFAPPVQGVRWCFGPVSSMGPDLTALERDPDCANERDVAVAPQLLDRAAGTVDAERGYDSDPLRRELTARGFPTD
jgi:hypothetical protein